MFADWPIARRIAASAVVALAVGVLLATLFDGLSPSYPVRLGQVVACVLASIVVIGLVVSFITSHLADYSEPADDEEFELLVRRTEQLARENLAAEPDEAEFMTLDPRNPEDFEELVRQARDDFPDRIIIFRDTLLRDFGHDPDELRAQVTRTVRHELAHHLGADELGVRELGL